MPSAEARPNNDGTRLTSTDQPDSNGILAGVLVDGSGKRPSKAYIQVVPADAANTARPVELAADDNGYFMIPGLTPGRSYMLTARTQETGRLLVGRMQARVPNSRLLIKLREDLAGGDVPPPPPSPGEMLPGNNRNTSIPSTGAERGPTLNPAPPPLPDPGRVAAPRSGDDGGWTPGGIGGSPAPLAPSGRDNTNIPVPAAPVPGFENIAERDRDRGAGPPPPPLINVPPAGAGTSTGPQPDPPPTGSVRPGSASGSSMFPRTQSPICEVSGQRITRLTLAELDGSIWDLQTHHGELVLLDFWGSWCQPCLRAIPHLKDLQRRYGAYGLEVVGIACENETGEERDQILRGMRQKLGISYPILLAEERSRCPVQRRLGINSYPTLMLVDKSGQVLARSDGANFAQIDAIIQQRLARR